MAPLIDKTETLHGWRQPVIGQDFDLGTQLEPLFSFRRTQQAAYVVTIIAINLLDFAITKCQFPHPIDATSHAGSQAYSVIRGRALETVGREIVGRQILSIIVWRDVIYMHLVAILQENINYNMHSIPFRIWIISIQQPDYYIIRWKNIKINNCLQFMYMLENVRHLNVIEEEVRVRQIEYHLFHPVCYLS